MKEPITFIADHVQLKGPRKTDGSYIVTFETGEYIWNQLKELPNLNGSNILVTVTQYEQ